jgi:hypothetical protein
MIKWPHKHRWAKIFSSRWGTVEKCIDCPEYQTTMFDYSTRSFRSVPGNFLAAQKSDMLFIICGSQLEFQNAQRILRLGNPDLKEDQIRYLTSIGILGKYKNPTIFFYGTWWENSICQDPEFTRIINGWL